MKFAFGLLAMVVPAVVQAQVLTGPARAVDGDTLDIGGQSIRLHGMDAPEAAQRCEKRGTPWSCGAEATALLQRLVSRGPVDCVQQAVDVYQRIIAVCSIRGLDLGLVMVDAGLAVALAEAPQEYSDSQDRQRALKAGIWGTIFELPGDYRAAHPELNRSPAGTAPPQTDRSRARTSRAASMVYFPSCRHARAAGAAPMYAGQAGYRAGLDGDGDGIACEPFRSRR